MNSGEEREARRIAEIAARAEARALERAKECAVAANNVSASIDIKGSHENRQSGSVPSSLSLTNCFSIPVKKANFLSKKQREALEIQRIEQQRIDDVVRKTVIERKHIHFVSGEAEEEKRHLEREAREVEERRRRKQAENDNNGDIERQQMVKAIRNRYLNSSSSSSSTDGDGISISHKKRRRMDDLGGFENRTHWKYKQLEEMTQRDWRIFNEDFDIRIQSGRFVPPLRFWQESPLSDPLLRAIESAGYRDPTPIQRQAVAVGLELRDLIAIAETGSGKTCAFMLPLVAYIQDLPRDMLDVVRQEGPLAIIMAPVRELAQQIEEECSKLCKYLPMIRSLCIVGGQSISTQTAALRGGIEVVVGTPGRLVDLLQSNLLVLNQCNYVVIDEADRMIDMGFEQQVLEILDAMNAPMKAEDERLAESELATRSARFRITAMFSATMPPAVERIARSFLRHPVIVKIGDEESGKNKRIEQRILFVSEGAKNGKLMEVIRESGNGNITKTIIFANLKKDVDLVYRQLESARLAVGVLHGGKSQDQRERTLELFRINEINILVATDVAGRGLDISDVAHVINYDMPKNIENYTHRIGRTGRAGKHGVSTTFLSERDQDMYFYLKVYLESTKSVVPIQLAKHEASREAPHTTKQEIWGE